MVAMWMKKSRQGVGRVGFEHAWLRAVGCPVIPYLEIALGHTVCGGSWYAVVNRYVPPIRCRAFRSPPVQRCHRAARGPRVHVATGQ